MEDVMLTEVLRQKYVIVTTLVSVIDKKLVNRLKKAHGNSLFDIAIIDEAAQSLELSTYLACLLARKVIMAGDHKQLEPTVKNQLSIRQGFSVSLFERMISSYPESSIQLKEQFRMCQSIMGWTNQFVYQDTLSGPKEVLEQKLET